MKLLCTIKNQRSFSLPVQEECSRSYLAGVLPTCTVTSTDHVVRDAAVERLAAVAAPCRHDGELDGAEGGRDQARVGAGVSPARHPAHSALGYGVALPRQQGHGDVAVEVDWGLQLDRWRRRWSANSQEDGPEQRRTHLYEHDVVVVGGVVVLGVGEQMLGQDFLFCALVDGQRVVACH